MTFPIYVILSHVPFSDDMGFPHVAHRGHLHVSVKASVPRCSDNEAAAEYEG